MLKNFKNQRGVTHILLIVLLLAGIVIGVYLIQQRTNILPFAQCTSCPVSPPPCTSCPTSPTPSPNTSASPSSRPAASSSSCQRDSDCPTGNVCMRIQCFRAPCNNICQPRQDDGGGPIPSSSPLPSPTSTPPNGFPDSSPSSSPTIIPGLKGDFNSDGRVNIVDFSIFLGYWRTNDAKGDLNKDGKINVVDLSALLSSWRL